VLSDAKVAPVVRLLPQDTTGIFDDSYLLDFLDFTQSFAQAAAESVKRPGVQQSI